MLNLWLNELKQIEKIWDKLKAVKACLTRNY